MNKELIVKQESARDCGACCLLSIIKFYKGYIPLEKIKLDTHTDMNGTTAFNLVNCAKKYGFDSSGIKCEIEDLKSNEHLLPAIAHIKTEKNLYHFVVIYKINKSKITIMDPAKGMKTISKDVFLKQWDGIILLLKPREKLLVVPQIPKISKIIYNVFSNEKNIIVKIIIYTILITILSIVGSYQLKIMINMISYKNKILFYFLLGIFGTLTIIKLLTEYFKSILESVLNKNIDAQIIIPFVKHIFNLPSNVVSNKSSGEILTRVNELANIKNLFSEIITVVLIDSILALSSIYFLFNLNKKLFFILCLIVFVYLIISLVFNPFIHKKINDNIDVETDFNSELVEKIESINSIKNLHAEQLINDNLEEYGVNYIRNSYELNNFLIILNTIQKTINDLGLVLINSVGLILIYNNELSLINLVTFNTLVAYFFEPIKNITSIIPKYNLIKLSIDKVSDFNSLEEEKFDKETDFILGNIEANNITFSYNDYNNILENQSFTINKGEKVFLNGTSGSGKSTICKILMRFINNYSGNIQIGGVNIKDYNVETIRNNICYVSQNEKLFTDTILNNLTLQKDISFSEINKILSICDINEIVDKKPLRLDTMLVDGGINLSGGEKQRIILARALLQNKKIIILDEALSELDVAKEKKIIKNIKKYYKDKTIIYIAHRDLSSLFDKVITIGGNYAL